MKEDNNEIKIELSEDGKALLEFVKEVQEGELATFNITPIYETTLPMFDLQPAPLYHIWGKVI